MGSVYPPPIATLLIFNWQEFNYSSSSLSISTADKRYLKIAGGIETGLVTFNGGLSTSTIYNGTGGQKSFSNIATFTTTNGIPGGQAFQVNSLTNPHTTRLYLSLIHI